MATYVPNATQTTEPVESRTVESAALEFRTLKGSINARMDTLQDNIDAEALTREAADDGLAQQIEDVSDYVSPYISQIANLGFDGNLDMGLISDAVIQNTFDMGGL